MTRHINGHLIDSGIFDSYVRREDVYTIDATRKEVHYFVTIDGAYAHENDCNGVRASHVCALINWLQQQHFKYMPFRARQLGTQIVLDSPYKYDISNIKDSSVKTASNGYKLILNAARTKERSSNYHIQFKTNNEHRTRELWEFCVDVSVSRKNMVHVSQFSITCKDDITVPNINVWVGTKTDKESWLQVLKSMG